MKKLVLPENKSVNDFRVMEEDAMDPGPDPGGVGAPPICFGAAAPPTGIFGAAADDDDDLRRTLLLFFLDIYGNNTNTNTNKNTIITIDYLSRRYELNRPRNAFFSFRIP